ncbi:unnamed protein product [Didymodactylos carnosus]|uniref:G-protein coupled receptors family 1 profile domain-containing protein n=1 Tax=Didymodactylos carnosus TaxID=1234261 RepID=A0A813Q0H2_9BILA|nr:unnamed protein product [Didymodactylos carnosus]CAF0793828.1 unnamed protein product [Didymodactylos carnosus]CAF3537457.1 unnamed protein product [Didymodactylos carnosus]CAF3576674.1 unnamed protein product [Didymodactylos carnosus]
METTDITTEIVSTVIVPSDNSDYQPIYIDDELTTYLIFLFPIYMLAIILNTLSIYYILITKIYRQYLSNIFLVCINISSIFSIHGHIFLVLLRWTNNSSSNHLCSISIYTRDSGFIWFNIQILLLTIERITSNLKYKNENNHRIKLFLILMTFISFILSITIPIYSLKQSYIPFDGLCIPTNINTYTKYSQWLYYGFGHPFLWSSVILLFFFYLGLLKRPNLFKNSINLKYANNATFFLTISTCVCLFIFTIFNDYIGIGQSLIASQNVSNKRFNIMNVRDFIIVIHKVIIGSTLFLTRRELRTWFYDYFIKCQFLHEGTIHQQPQIFDIKKDIQDDDYHDSIVEANSSNRENDF